MSFKVLSNEKTGEKQILKSSQSVKKIKAKFNGDENDIQLLNFDTFEDALIYLDRDWAK